MRSRLSDVREKSVKHLPHILDKDVEHYAFFSFSLDRTGAIRDNHARVQHAMLCFEGRRERPQNYAANVSEV